MSEKSLWQSMTGWMNKPAGSLSSESSSGPAEPAPSAPAPAPAGPAEASGAGSATPRGEAAPPPAGAAFLRPDEGPEINRKIVEVIKTCYDPEIPVNIYELGLVYDVKVDPEKNAHVTMTLTAPNCPAAQSLPAEVKSKIEAIDEIQSASVEIVFDPPWTPNNMSDSAKLALNML